MPRVSEVRRVLNRPLSAYRWGTGDIELFVSSEGDQVVSDRPSDARHVATLNVPRGSWVFLHGRWRSCPREPLLERLMRLGLLVS